MKCRIGCDACCHTPFSISELEAARIAARLERLDHDARTALRRRARRYLEARRRLLERNGYWTSRGELAPAAEQLPCPALENGRCAIYEERPLLCRRFGAPVWHAHCPDRVFACELNFPPGQTIEDDRLLEAQQRLAERREQLESRFDSSGGARYAEPLSVAHACLHDFDRF